MTDLNTTIAITALNHMFAGIHFSICTIDNVAKVLGVVPQADTYAQLRALHCVHWSEMPPALRDRIPALIEQTLSGAPAFRFDFPPTDRGAIELVDTPEPRRPLIARLIGR